MGIDGLLKVLKAEKASSKEVLQTKRIIWDGSGLIHTFDAIRELHVKLLRITQRVRSLLSVAQTLIICFDGMVPQTKAAEVAARRKRGAKNIHGLIDTVCAKQAA